jgi:hypothetical protein
MRESASGVAGATFWLTMRNSILLCSVFLAVRVISAAPLNRSVFTEVVQDVSILDSATRKPRGAKVNDAFSTPDVLRTGPNSRAELLADDKTVTRVGANTIFSFEANKREINLQQGSVLFNSPSGKGGGTIRTAAATAAVLGTTLIVSATPNGGFKVLMIEGRGQITSGGSARSLTAGQMTFVLPGQRGLSPAYNFQLKEQVGNSKLIRGFRAPLQSLPKIAAAVSSQESKITKGTLAQTNLLATDTPGVVRVVDPAVLGNLQVLVGDDSNIANRLARGEIGPGDTAVVSQSQLDSNRILALPNAGAFIAGNTIFRTSSVDIAGYGSSFAFLSTNDLRFESQMQVTGGSGGSLSFLAGGTISNSPGATVETENDAVLLGSLDAGPSDSVDAAVRGAGSRGGNVFLQDFAFANLGGSLELNARDAVLNNAGLWAKTDLNIRTGDFSVSNGLTSLSSWSEDDDSGTSFEQSPRNADTKFSKRGTALEAGNMLSIQTAGSFRAVRTDLVGETIRIGAGNDIQLNSVRLSNKDFDPGRGAAILNASNLVNVTGARFQVGLVNINARTVNLTDVRFSEGSRVRLFCESGRYTLDASRPVDGRVNFRDVSYGSEDISGELAKGGASQVQVRRR